MKKLFFLILLTLPFFLNAQFDGKNCHTDLVFGFDIGDGFIFPNGDDFRIAVYEEKDKLIYGFRIGTNINYPIADRIQLVTGFRLSNRVVKTYDAPLILHEAYTEKVLHDFFLEVPFRGRYVFGFSKNKNQLYLEGGLDVNIYVASFAKDSIEKVFGRAESYHPFSLSANLAPGFEIESNQNNLSYFIQPILKLQMTGKKENSDLRFYHIGIETGIRF